MIITNEQIQNKLKEIAEDINNRYKEITLLIVLTGGVYTGIDLSRYITIPCKIEFIKASSYGNSEVSSGMVKIEYCSIKENNENILIIDDIYDTGRTMHDIVNYIKANYKYKSVSTFCLLNKPNNEIPMELTYSGFPIEGFVYGYGLDLAGYERNLLAIKVKD